MPKTNEGVSVPYGAILDQLHQRYGKTIAQLMQENAELQAACDAQASELEEYKARFMAMAQGTSQPIDGSAWSGGLPDAGLLGAMAPAAFGLPSGHQAGPEQDGHPEGNRDGQEAEV